jgi:Mg2+ and Co2+ transporter CorA
MDKTLLNLTKIRTEMNEISKIRNKTMEIKTNTKGIQRIIREILYANKLKNLEEMNKFQDTYEHPKLNQEYIDHLNKSTTY